MKLLLLLLAVIVLLGVAEGSLLKGLVEDQVIYIKRIILASKIVLIVCNNNHAFLYLYINKCPPTFMIIIRELILHLREL